MYEEKRKRETKKTPQEKRTGDIEVRHFAGKERRGAISSRPA